MKTANRSKWMLSIAVVIVLAASVGAVHAASHAGSASRHDIVRIVPAATPVELNPCASGGCW